MIGVLSTHIVQFLLKNRWLFWVIVAGALAFLINGFSRLSIQEDLYSIFPKGKEYKQFNDIIQKNNLNRQIVFSIRLTSPDTDPYDQIEKITQQLQRTFKNDLKDFQVYRDVNEKQLISFLQRSAILYLNTNDYRLINSRLQTDSINTIMQKNAQTLKNGGFFSGQLLAQDPLGISFSSLRKLNESSNKGNYVLKDGLLYSKDEQTIFFFANIIPSLQNTSLLVDLNDRLAAFKINYNQSKKYAFDYFGTFQIAAENAKQIKRDTFLTTIISVSLIFLLLVFYFKSVFAPIYFVLPALFGMLFGVGITGYIRPDINAISLATSSVLLGIVLDYSFHFYSHLKERGDLLTTIREVASPLFLGSFTTIAALGALMFTNSVVLQDFGLIALCTLSGSVFFTLWILPVLISSFNIRLQHTPFLSETALPKKKRAIRIGIYLVLIGGLAIFFKGPRLNFDADLNHLSYHSDELIKKEEQFTGLHPSKEKKLFIVAKAQNEEEARQINDSIYKTLLESKHQYKISELLSLAPYEFSTKSLRDSREKWDAFWIDKKPGVEQAIKAAGSTHGFTPEAFIPFFNWIHGADISPQEGELMSKDLGLNNLKYVDKQQTTYITSIVLDRSELAHCKSALNKINGAFIMDISELSEKMLGSVQKDFNYLLLFSAILVFATLLLVYGRIELAIITFFPMLLGWVWILGVSDLLNIQFNFVNIVVTTFIFGLGDDFSIFTTDGLIQRYKKGINFMGSSRNAILLSGITTIIGTGVLIFAQHPSIHSIAVISVVGIASILFISLYVQPSVFNFFVFRRKEKNRGPLTFFTLIYSLTLFTYFFLGSLFLNVLLLALIILPIQKKRKRQFINWMVSKLAKSTIYAGFHVKKRVVNRDKLDFSKPSIIVANHSSFLDILLVIMLHPRSIIMVKSWVYNSPVFGLFIRYAGYPFADDGAEGNIDVIRERIAEGYSIVIFPEGTRSNDGEIKRFHKGAFYLARQLNLPIQPLLLIGTHEVNPKNDVMIQRGHLNIVALDSMYSIEGETEKDFTKRVQNNMRSAYISYKKELGSTDFWKNSILQNYIFKGPGLEWYVRIKWRLEQKNYAFYDKEIGERVNIYDVGCGYGYLSYFLHYRNNNRLVQGVDYDADKIAVAANGIKKNEHLTFSVGDIRDLTFEGADCVLMNDVLHYLKTDEQIITLQRIVDGLNDKGQLFIRDGLDGMKQKTFFTQLTEIISTKILKFNKTSNQLYFLKEEMVVNFANENGLKLRKYDHSKTTSNVLFILEKP